MQVVLCIFALDLTLLDILTFQNIDLQIVGQGHGVYFSIDTIRWHMSKSTKDSYTFYASSYGFRDTHILYLYPQKVGQGQVVRFFQ